METQKRKQNEKEKAERRMKIVAGLGSIDEYIPYVLAGADELFCGYVPYNWTKKYGTVLPLNRREVLAYNVQLGSFSELEILSAMIRKYRKPVHIAMNSLYYIPEQYEEIADIVKQCMKIGFDSFILADPALILYLRQKGISCKIHPAWVSLWSIASRAFCSGVTKSTSGNYCKFYLLYHARANEI